jgi:hypothetical protein
VQAKKGSACGSRAKVLRGCLKKNIQNPVSKSIPACTSSLCAFPKKKFKNFQKNRNHFPARRYEWNVHHSVAPEARIVHELPDLKHGLQIQTTHHVSPFCTRNDDLPGFLPDRT